MSGKTSVLGAAAAAAAATTGNKADQPAATAGDAGAAKPAGTPSQPRTTSGSTAPISNVPDAGAKRDPVTPTAAGSAGAGPEKPGPEKTVTQKASPEKASPEKTSPDKTGPDAKSAATAASTTAAKAGKDDDANSKPANSKPVVNAFDAAHFDSGDTSAQDETDPAGSPRAGATKATAATSKQGTRPTTADTRRPTVAQQRRRGVLVLLALVVVVGLALALIRCGGDQPGDGAAVTVATQPDDTAAQPSTTADSAPVTASTAIATVTQPPTDTQAVEVTRGDLVIDDTVDGTLEETGTIAVIHRIDDQSAATTVPAESGAIAGASAKRFSELAQAGPGADRVPAATRGTRVIAVGANLAGRSVGAATATTAAAATTTTLVYPASTTTTLVYPAPTTTTLVEPAPTTTTSSTTTTTTTTCPPTTAAPPKKSNTGGSSTGAGSGSTGKGAAGPSGAGTTAGNGMTETVTGIAPVGEAVKSGDVLYTVDGQPVIALTGTLAATRTLSPDSTDGPDIAQLEQALVALGYDPDGDVVVDEEWTPETTAMVERWQKASDIDPTGTVPLGSVVFIDHSATVTEVLVADGESITNGTKVMSLSGTSQLITIAVPSELQGLLAIGSEVTVDGVAATVTDLRSAETEGGPQTIGVQALITPSEPLDAEPGATVKVEIRQAVATDELLVPSDAIVSRRDGTYAVQVPGDGDAEYVTVTILGTVGSKTAIASDELDEQSKVVTKK